MDKYRGLLLILFTLCSALLGVVDFTLIPFIQHICKINLIVILIL